MIAAGVHANTIVLNFCAECKALIGDTGLCCTGCKSDDVCVDERASYHRVTYKPVESKLITKALTPGRVA